MLRTAALPLDRSTWAARFHRWQDVCKWLPSIAIEADRRWDAAEYSESRNVSFQFPIVQELLLVTLNERRRTAFNFGALQPMVEKCTISALF
jgi:hypothetical protein